MQVNYATINDLKDFILFMSLCQLWDLQTVSDSFGV